MRNQVSWTAHFFRAPPNSLLLYCKASVLECVKRLISSEKAYSCALQLLHFFSPLGHISSFFRPLLWASWRSLASPADVRILILLIQGLRLTTPAFL